MILKAWIIFTRLHLLGVRIIIINLSPNSPVIKVALSTSAGTSEFGDIAYKQITDFKPYSATSANTEYTFEFRDAATDELISSITMSGVVLSDFVPVFRNVTLVFRDVVGGGDYKGKSLLILKFRYENQQATYNY